MLAAIADLKARGLQVTLYPMVLMDVPAGNALTDPYGGARAGGLSLARAHHLRSGARGSTRTGGATTR